MRLHSDGNFGLVTVTGYDIDHILVNGRRFDHSLIIAPREEPKAWAISSVDDINEAILLPLVRQGFDVVLLGTGHKQRFLRPAMLQAFMAAGLGVELMDTAAACRTYNILVGEGRNPLAALIVEQG